MKKILIISTGGTICSSLSDGCRRLTPDLSQTTLIRNFFENEKYASLSRGVFQNSSFEPKTLSENMTFEKLEALLSHISSFRLSDYSGVIVLHGTDTLAYTAALLSLVFSDTPVPIMLVSGDAPCDEERSNANVNFAAAFDYIVEGIAPNVYVPYRNGDGIQRLHLASRLMQSPSFSSDFFSAGSFDTAMAKELSASRKAIFKKPTTLDGSVLLVQPYVNLNYDNIELDGLTAVAHGSYHSGTFCTEGGARSLLSFAKRCDEHDVTLFVAPCEIGEEQYEGVVSAVQQGSVAPAPMTTEMLYIKLTLGISLGLHTDELKSFVLNEINNEFIWR